MVAQEAARDPVADLRRIAFLLERANEATYRVRAFRGAASALAGLSAEEISSRATAGTLTDISGVGDVTAQCVIESLHGEEPVYLRRLAATAGSDVDEATTAMRRALRGDCHSHSDWSDGGSTIEEMLTTAIELGHEYLVITDHSPRLTVARGLSAERLRQQITVVASLNETLAEAGANLRLLTGIEVDILADGSLDQDDELLDSLDVVVGSVHSGLRDDSETMTRRMLTAIANPRVDILGHCTGRRLAASFERKDEAGRSDATRRSGAAARRGAGPRGDRAHRGGRGRPESQFDVEAVFTACAQLGKAVEINSRPDRLDPPKRLLRRAYEIGCMFAIDSDAHAPGQLDWLNYGCERAALCGVETDRVINTWSSDRLLAWATGH